MTRHLADAFTEAAQAHERESPPQGLRVQELLHLHGEASAAVLLMVMALLSVLPVAGVGSVLSVVILALAWHWHAAPGRELLPARLTQLRLSPTWSRRSLKGLAWLYDRADRWLARRWSLLSHPRSHGLWRVWMALMALVIFLPLPLGNVLPALSLMLLSLGWICRDGIALCLSALVGGGALAFTASMGHVLLRGLDWAWQRISPVLAPLF